MRELNVKSIRSVEKAIDIINTFSTAKPKLTIDEICNLTKLPKATAYRLLYTLERKGIIRYDAESLEYTFGFQLLGYSQILLSSLDIIKESEQILTELQASTGQTVLMSILDGDSMVYVFKRENQVGLKYSSAVSERRPLTYGVLGRVSMAFLPDTQIKPMLRAPLPKWTSHTITDKHVLGNLLQQIRIDGIAVETDETNIGVTAIGAPIFNIEGNIIAAVGVIGPTIQLSGDDLHKSKDLLKHATQRISENMGYQNRV